MPWPSPRCSVALIAAVMQAAICCGDLSRADEPPGGSSEPTRAAREATPDYFQEYVLPIFKQHCFECHSHAAGKAKGGLMLDSRGGWAKGGDTGPAIVPGKPDESLLIQAVHYTDLEMPPSGKLPAEAVATLERWVAAGAVDPRVSSVPGEPTGAQQAGDLEARRQHWAFQPLGTANLPEVQDTAWPIDAIDRFLLARLEAQHVRPAPDADRYTWLRRVSLDLTGLPPTATEITTFVGDASPGTYERVVDRLLASRAFGERWARHWLDLVGYADQLATDNNLFAEHAWRYRDWLIAALNADKPYDQFVREQVAGDLLPYDSPQQRASQLVATGFLLLGDVNIAEGDKTKLGVDVVDQQVDKTGRAFLGLTLGCARCHDHKFDPVSQREYYALAGIFNSTESVHKARWGLWSWITEVELPETEAQQTERQARLEGHQLRLAGLKTEREKLEARKKEVDEALKTPAPTNNVAAAGATKADSTAPAVGPAAADGRPVPHASPPEPSSDRALRAALEKTRDDLAARLKTVGAEIAHAEFFAPAPPKAFAVRDVAQPGDMRITIRGNPRALGELVPRGFLQIAPATAAAPVESHASGRRQLADWLTSPQNPLTPRVAVNRIWEKLFGAGIVRSVDYFGLPSDPPSHPELLDYLARRFMAGGWSQKQLIRALVLSRAYRLSSQGDAELLAADPDNRLFGRMHRRRLDAEALRDTLLSVSGRLLESNGGPSLPLEDPRNIVNLVKDNPNPPGFALNRFRPEQQYQRTVYLPVIRSGPQPGPAELRGVFDFTQPADFAWQRATTSVPTQALFLMNSKLMKDRAHDLAVRITHEAADDGARLERLWLRALNRPIQPAEHSQAAEFLAAEHGAATGDAAQAADERAWSELCHALLASNEFLMRM